MTVSLAPTTPAPHTATGKTLPAWPLTGVLLLYPLWWALGLGVLIFPLVAVPMAVLLLRAHVAGRPVRLPPGFALWAVFLAAVVAGVAVLGAEPAGAVDEHARGRVLGAGYRVVQYAALTVLLVYAGNLTEAELTRRRLVRLLAWLFAVTVAGGLLGVFAGHFEFTSPVEQLLPPDVRDKGFVQSLVHPYAAQVMDVVRDAHPRPAAPWGYTNTWGNNFCLLVVWFAAWAWGYPARRRTRSSTGRLAPLVPAPDAGSIQAGRSAPSSGLSRRRILALACLAVSLVPVVHSLNRGLWIGLGVAAVYVAVRLALAGRAWAIGGLGVAAATLASALALTPLGGVVGARLDDGHSNGVRSFLMQRAVAGMAESPVVGFGSTRTTMGGRNSITVGESAACERCGNFTIGGNGQLWQLLFAHGLVGTAGYLGFFGYGLWRFRRDRSPIGIAGGCAVLGGFAAMLWYNALVTPLAFMFLAYALLWRNESCEREE